MVDPSSDVYSILISVVAMDMVNLSSEVSEIRISVVVMDNGFHYTLSFLNSGRR